MPVKRIVTCDLCGKGALVFPSFFSFKNINENKSVSTDIAYSWKRAPKKLKVSPDFYGWESARQICLCKDHYDDLILTIEDWFDKIDIQVT